MDVHSGLWSLMCPWGGSFNYHKLRNGTAAGCQALFDIMQPAFRCDMRPHYTVMLCGLAVAVGLVQDVGCLMQLLNEQKQEVFDEWELELVGMS